MVRMNDQVTIEEIRQLVLEGFVDSIVISPGPGTPARESDIGEDGFLLPLADVM